MEQRGESTEKREERESAGIGESVVTNLNLARRRDQEVSRQVREGSDEESGREAEESTLSWRCSSQPLLQGAGLLSFGESAE